MKKITMISAFGLMLLGYGTNAQTVTVIDPDGDGGFEQGATFEANGWEVNNASYGSRKWQVGTGQPGYSGDRGAFIGASETTVGTNAGGRTCHFYRTINIPAGAQNILITFNFKQEVVFMDPESGPNDYIYLSLLDEAPGTGNTPSSSQFTDHIPTAGPVTDYTPMSFSLPSDIAGAGDKVLVFTFRSNNLNDPSTIGWPAIDDIQLTYEGIMGTSDFGIKGFSYYPNPVNNVLNLNAEEQITGVTVTNLLGQQVMQVYPNAAQTSVDTSSLAKGTYIVTVAAGNNKKTIKVIK